MFRQFLENVTGSSIYLISSLWIFFIFFILVIVMLFKMKKNHIQYMSNLPLNDDKTKEI